MLRGKSCLMEFFVIETSLSSWAFSALFWKGRDGIELIIYYDDETISCKFRLFIFLSKD